MQEENNPNQLREEKVSFPFAPIQFSNFQNVLPIFFSSSCGKVFFPFCHTNKKEVERRSGRNMLRNVLRIKIHLASLSSSQGKEIHETFTNVANICNRFVQTSTERRLRVIFKLETLISFYISICLNSSSTFFFLLH